MEKLFLLQAIKIAQEEKGVAPSMYHEDEEHFVFGFEDQNGHSISYVKVNKETGDLSECDLSEDMEFTLF